MTVESQHLDFTVNKSDFKDDLLKVLGHVRPRWRKEDIQFEYLKQGFVNIMLKCKVNEDPDDWLVARIFGLDLAGSGFQQRDREFINSRLMSDLDLGPKVYGTFSNGIIYGFVKGRTYFWDDLSPFRDIKLLNAVARALAKLHSKTTRKLAIEKYDAGKGVSMEDAMASFSNLWPDLIVDEETTKWYESKVPTKEERTKELALLFDDLMNIGSPPTELYMCHNDCNPTNIIYDEENDRVTLVDFEMCGLAKPDFDLSNFLQSSAAGFAPDPTDLFHSPDVEREVIRTYLTEKMRLDEPGADVTEQEIDDMMEYRELFSIVGGYVFHIIAVQIASAPKRQDNIDPKMFLGIGLGRLAYYFKNRKRVFELFDKHSLLRRPSSDSK